MVRQKTPTQKLKLSPVPVSFQRVFVTAKTTIFNINNASGWMPHVSTDFQHVSCIAICRYELVIASVAAPDSQVGIEWALSL
jgi:hypothetical protein